MAKPRLSTGRIPFELGISAGVAPVGPIINACAVLSQLPKPLAIMLPMARTGTLYQLPKPLALMAMTSKPIATLAQRSC